MFLILGHASLDSTAIIGREKACRKNTPKLKLKKKRGRKSKAEKAALVEQEIAEVKTRRLEVQPHRNLPENLADLPQGCDWGGKRDSKGKTSYWCGYKLLEVNKTKSKNSPTLKNSQKFVKWGQWFNTRSNSEKVINFEITDFSMYGDFLPKIDACFL